MEKIKNIIVDNCEIIGTQLVINDLQILADEIEEEIIKICTWTKAFDGHYNISCVSETKERGNGNFNIKWKFKYCPYCGGKLKFNLMKFS